MTVVFWALLLLVILAAVAGVLLTAKYRRKKIRRSLRQLESMGMEQGLNFSAQAFLNELLVGLDGVNRKLLVMNLSHPSRFELVCLDDLSRCRLQKTYPWPHRVEAHGVLDVDPDRIWIEFQFSDGRPSFELPFYDARTNDAATLSIREQKAKDWVTVISKMLKRPAMRRA